MKKNIKGINQFLAQKEVAVVGASRNPRKFGYMAFSLLKKNQYLVYPVNPNIDFLDGVKCFPDISSLPDTVTAAFIITPVEHTANAVTEAISKGIKYIWIQRTAESTRAIEIAEKNDVYLVKNECIFMFIDPRKIPHNIHRFVKKMTGNLPE